jgi:hypothetical protein
MLLDAVGTDPEPRIFCLADPDAARRALGPMGGRYGHSREKFMMRLKASERWWIDHV